MIIDFRVSVEEQAQIIQPKGDGTIWKLFLQGGVIMASSATPTVVGDWDGLAWSASEKVFSDTNVIDFHVQMAEGEVFLILYTLANGTIKVGVWPGDFPLYGNKDPYRIYWGTDSHILYMNVESTWVPVSVMNDEGTSGLIEYERSEW